MNLVDLSIRINPVVRRVLRSPLHWLLSPGLMLITVTGRKTGRVYTIPVGYHEVDGEIVILVSEAPRKVWWRNFVEPGPIGLRLRGRDRHGIARVVPAGSAEYRRRAEASLRRARFMRRVLGVDFDARTGLTDAQVAELGARVAIVRVSDIA